MGKLDEKEKQLEILSASRIFSLNRLKSNADINFYTGLSNFASFMSIFEFLNPGEDGTNIGPQISSDIPKEFYDSDLDKWM